MTERRSYPPNPLRAAFLSSFLVAMAGLMLSTALFWVARQSELNNFGLQFERDAVMRSNLIAQKMEDCLFAIKALQRFFSISEHVDREEFEIFTVPFLEEQRELQALEWIPSVSYAERTRFQDVARQQGMPNFQITERDPNGSIISAGEREAYYPVFYVEPLKGNEKAVGFDLGSDPIRRVALERARDTGKPTVTERIRLVQETGEQFGFLIFLPVYRKGMQTETVEQRREALEGFGLGVFRAGNVLRAVLGSTESVGLPFYLLDLSAPADRRHLHHWSERFNTKNSWKSHLFPIPPRYLGKFAFAGREWGVELTASPAYMVRHYPFAYWLILPVGFLLSLVLGFYLRAILGRRVQLERLVLERTSELQESNARTSHLNDVLRAIRDTSSVIRTQTEPLELLTGVCNSLVQTRSYVTVWIGQPEAGSKRVLPVAHSGAGSDLLQHATITWDDSPTGQGPAGTAMRECRSFVLDDFAKDPRFALGKDPVTAYGAASIASVPLLHHERLFGVMTVKADRPQAFDVEEMDLLNTLAADIARALQSLEDEGARKRAEQALRESNEELRRIPCRLIAAQEEERRRLASELHDSIGQTLAALKYRVEYIATIFKKGRVKEAIRASNEYVATLQRAIDETRSIYMGLRPKVLEDFGVVAALMWYRDDLIRLYPERHIEMDIRVEETEISRDLVIPIFRITQEALNNASKHSKAEWVDVSLSLDGNEIELVVSDDGIGMDVNQILHIDTARSLGLTSMRERAEFSSGKFMIESIPGEGTIIRVVWPI